MARKRPVQGSGQKGLLEGGVSENNEEKPAEGKEKCLREPVQILGGQDGSAVFRNRRKDREATVQG